MGAPGRSATPVAVVRRYLDEINHAGDTEVIREITVDGLVRHDPGASRTLDHEAQIARIAADLPQWQPWFTAEVLAGDDEYAVLVWTAPTRPVPGADPAPGKRGPTMSRTTVPTPSVPLLERTSEIDARWMSAVLGSSYPGAVVRAVALRPIGAGNVSDTVHVTIDYDDRPEGAPDAVVAKFRPLSPDVHEHGLGSGAYHREIGGYRVITERDACRIPRLFHVDGDETNINLVIEDLTAATPGDQVAGCGPVEARAVLTQLARLHAAFSPLDPDTAPSWPIRMADAADYWTPMVQRGAAIAGDRYPERLSDDDLRTVAAAGELARAWHLLPQTRLSLTHGDPRVDNVLFEPVDGGCRAVLIDWQVTGLRNPMYDVGYFLSGSLGIADRRAHEPGLLDHYLREFSALDPSYTAGEALDDYRTQVMSGLMITTAALAVLPDVDQVNTLILALLERNCAAVADWNAVEETRRRAPGSIGGR